jgi:hypothetical protein
MSIFDLIMATEIVAYWEELRQDEAPYPTEELFPVDKKLGLNLSWIKGSRGLPVVLKTSAFDAAAIPRPRIGFEKLETEMPYFKESKYVDEEMRQQLNMVLETGNQAYINTIMTRIFDDEMSLLRGARASRERMRMMALTTGVIVMANNGQQFEYDYGIPDANKVDASVAWSDEDNSDPIEDIRQLKEDIYARTGVVVSRAMCDNTTWKHIRNNAKIKNQIYAIRPIVGALTNQMVRDFISDQLDGFTVAVNEMRYSDENNQTQKFMPENTFVVFPAGNLGKTWFGTTPAESDLMSGAAANVAITDTGVAVVTTKKVDPVNVETIVSMICLPSMEQADHIGIIDTNPS